MDIFSNESTHLFGATPLHFSFHAGLKVELPELIRVDDSLKLFNRIFLNFDTDFFYHSDQ